MPLQKLTWKPPENWLQIHTIDAHTGGEPLRIITSGLPKIKGNTILEKRAYFKKHYDHLRTGLMWEPRGHADQYGAILTEPSTKDGDIGVFFLHNEGYSTMCGHAVIALTKVLFDTGMIQSDAQNPVLKLDTPAGRVRATAFRNEKGVVEKASFLNVPSFVYLKNQQIEVKGIGKVEFDIAFGGAFYAYCNASKLGIDLTPDSYNQLIDWGRRIKYAVMEQFDIVHPFEADLGFLYGTIFIGAAQNPQHHSRNVCIFAEGEVDRSPTGTGVSGRAALHFSRNEIAMNQSIRIESILDTCMDVEVTEITTFGGYEAVVPKVSGMAYITGQHTFCFDPDDELNKGFIFR
ncbi:MAG: proline racemase family protein [Chitinophagales bacterium]